MSRWLYRLRYIVHGVLFLRRFGWPFRAAWVAVRDDFDGGDDERHEGYSPEESVIESMGYWE